NSPDEWRATTTGDKWITISPSSGAAGESKVKLTVKPNDSGKSRNADIIFKSGEKSASLKVSQEFGYFFNLPCATYTIGYGGGKITIGGLPERRFRIGLPVNAQSWIKVMGNVLDVSANLTELGRTATLTITNEEINQKYEVLLIQTSKTGNNSFFAIKELKIDGYNVPSDSFTEVSDFLYSVDEDAPATRSAKVEFSGDGVDWITIGDKNSKKIYSGDTATFTGMAPGEKITIYSHNKNTDVVGENILMITSLPIVTIYSSESIKDEPKVDCNFAIFDPKKRTDAEEKNLEYFESKAGIEYRGAGAMRYPKKPYNFKLYDSAGEKREAEILNIRNDNSWILDAMYLDMARMRNRVCFDLWNTFNKPYYVNEKPKAMSGTRGHYVEVFVNGQYMGLFMLTDRIDRKQYQIEQNGGYIYKAKGWSQACYLQGYTKPSNDDYYWNSAEIEQEYPDADDGQKPNFNHMADFIDFVSKTSKSNFSANFSSRVDENSVIDTFIFLNLILGYDNAGRNTFWIFRNINESKKVMHGLWDLDGVLGRDWNRVTTSATVGWYYGNNPTPSGTNYFKLFKRIIDGDVEGLQQKIYDRWMELKDKQLAPAEFNKLVDYYAEKQITSGARDREIARWREEETKDAATGTNGWIHYSGNYGDVEWEVNYMKSWYNDLMKKLDKLMATFNGK
ncbi:MAG: CotH kinase family protein, partial [Alistipes sp.]|nr:CotH kinase family protein [Alistipes sp.]